ncbi:MAG: DNA-binding protein [Bacteroidetes bacterium RIFCSPLOWO2_02_FULL_36_8]|nr:MAG: DNA-binding protein [Bacteroidetes bacterium RIFCSPLOWO2_02_FULL_36_8]OFY72075.1 MAG: DNA-binding protein [Bacteroidetes bacterium RIFCSPLOWO2_12_FULL_37_12]
MHLQSIQTKIHEIRGQKVMLDFDLAKLYKVENRALKQAVKRNIDRFPNDFVFVLSDNEVSEMVSQIVIPSKSYFGGALPFAFTEQGVSMLSSVLRSKKAIQVNIAVMRAFVIMRHYALSHKDLTEKLKEMENRYNRQFKDVYEALKYLMDEKNEKENWENRRRIGYR